MKFLVIGNDKRQWFLGKYLARKNDQVIPGEEYRNQPVDVILLPVAKSQNYQERICKYLREGQLVFGSGFTREFQEYCCKNHVELVDYMKCPGVAVRNAVNVAEGAIAEALKQGGPVIQGSTCLVTGYGICGKKLSEKLMAWKAKVWVVETSFEKRQEALADGCVCAEADFSGMELGKADYIFNTVPEIIFKEQELAFIKRDAVVIDLASAPGGFDLAACGKAGIHVEQTPGLPGIYGADSAARILLEVIEQRIL